MTERLGWPDASRGFITVIIVIYHASLVLAGFDSGDRWSADLIQDYVLTGMALFFLISGMNSTKYINADWRTFWRSRLGPMLWLLVVWTVLYWFIYDVALPGGSMGVRAAIAALFWAMIAPTWVLWFLWALTLYLVLTRLTAKLPGLPVMIVGGLLAAVGPTTPDLYLQQHDLSWLAEHHTTRTSLGYAVFFYAGYRYRPYIVQIGKFPLPLMFAACIGVASLAGWVSDHVATLPIDLSAQCVLLLANLGAAVSVGRVISLIPGVGPMTRVLGKATLPVYLVHHLILSVAVAVLPFDGALRPYVGSPLLLATIVLLTIILSLAIAIGAVRVGMGWLFRPPPPVVRLHDYLLRKAGFGDWSNPAGVHVDPHPEQM